MHIISLRDSLSSLGAQSKKPVGTLPIKSAPKPARDRWRTHQKTAAWRRHGARRGGLFGHPSRPRCRSGAHSNTLSGTGGAVALTHMGRLHTGEGRGEALRRRTLSTLSRRSAAQHCPGTARGSSACPSARPQAPSSRCARCGRCGRCDGNLGLPVRRGPLSVSLGWWWRRPRCGAAHAPPRLARPGRDPHKITQHDSLA